MMNRALRGCAPFAAPVAALLAFTIGAPSHLAARTGLKRDSQHASIDAISGPEDARALLAKMRETLGGEARLAAVRTLLIKGVDELLDADGRVCSRQAFTRKVLMPDGFQNTLDDLACSFTILGSRFWRKPPLQHRFDADAKRNLLRDFAELCLLMLVRSPAQVSMSAAVEKVPPTGNGRLVFTGDIVRTLELDADRRPHVLEHLVDMYSAGATVPFRTTRRVVIESWAQTNGIWFPATMSTAISSRPSIRTTLSEVRVNEGVTSRDFIAPSE